VLSALGGLVGIALALGACLGLSGLVSMPFIFDPGIKLPAFLFSAAIGIVFDYVPARSRRSAGLILSSRCDTSSAWIARCCNLRVVLHSSASPRDVLREITRWATAVATRPKIGPNLAHALTESVDVRLSMAF
jgi:hypothetical protein